MTTVRRFWLVLAASLLPVGLLHAEDVKSLPAQAFGYVNDFAGVLDSGSKQQLTNLCGELDHQAHAQVAVVTVHNLGGESKEDFAHDLFLKWGIGDKATDRGALLLFAIDDRKDYVEIGYGLQGILPDARVGDILRAARPLMQQGQYGPAILQDVQQMAGVIASDAGVTLTEQPTYHRRPVQQGVRVASIVRILIFLFILFLIFRRRGGRGGGGYGGGGGGFWPGFLIGNLLGGGSRGWGGGGDRGGWGGGDGGGSDGGFGGFGGGSSDGGGAGGNW